MIAFGPVPSRRLGRSIGINNIPPKVCSYACVYCQLGRAIQMRAERKQFYNPHEVARAVKEKLEAVQAQGGTVDYLTFVPDGEPTLDLSLAQEIDALLPLGVPLAIISNSSTIHNAEVRRELSRLHWVSLKADAGDAATWKKVDRPYKTLRYDAIAHGQLDFASSYKGRLMTETMLIEGYNTQEGQIERTAEHVAKIGPEIAYLSIPTRPPAVSAIQPASEENLAKAYSIFSQKLPKVEYLIGYEGNAFAATGNAEEDILSITAVHPMRQDALELFLKKQNEPWALVERLLSQGKLIAARYQDNTFFVRKLRERQMG